MHERSYPSIPKTGRDTHAGSAGDFDRHRPRARSWVRPGIAALLSAGLIGIVGFIAWHDYAAMAALVGRIGWGVAVLPAFFLIPLIFATASWRCLIPDAVAPSFATLTKATWVGLAVNDLLPGGGLTAEVARVRLVMGSRLPAYAIGASLIVDKTVQVLAIVILGAGATAVLPLFGASAATIAVAAVGSSVLAAGAIGFFVSQRLGLLGGGVRAMAVVLGGRRHLSWSTLAGQIDQEILRLHRLRSRIATACLLKLAFRLGLVAEVWVISVLVHEPIALIAAFAIEGLSTVLRAAAFVVPGALGVQEGSYVLLGAIAGLDPALMLVLALIKRGREVLVGIPALGVWQAAEGRSVLRAGRLADPLPPSDTTINERRDQGVR